MSVSLPSGVLVSTPIDVPELVGWRGKRLLDVTLSLVLLVLFLPVLLVAAILVKASSSGPILFRQQRIGLGGRPFLILKLRTMHTEAEHRLRRDPDLLAMYLNADFKIPKDLDPRVTRVGRFLRTTSIDELPQLFNVLVGHMSLVGPRPVTEPEVALYEEHARAYLAHRPGITGLWQVSGRNEIMFPRRAALDGEYAARCSPGLDLRVLLRTPATVISRRGAN
ncbi:MAG: sugar transferase [Actinomycetota bacterium]|nr:sugar transferase [Actinomycetota bacterium]